MTNGNPRSGKSLASIAPASAVLPLAFTKAVDWGWTSYRIMILIVGV
jgi:hypothetical protein